jgi:hypothetical protein
MAQRQADALVLLAEAALHHGIDPGTSGERYQVVVHVDAAVLANADQPGQSVLEEAGRVSAETSQRLACDASRVVMQEDADGNIVEIGARTRTIPPALRRALQRRDKRCTFPGCHVRIAEGHHIEHWAHGGPTKLSNLALLCRRHHRAVHEDGFRLERKPEGALLFYHPNGGCCRTCRNHRPCRPIRSTRCARRTRPTACRSIHRRSSPCGRARRSTSAG